MVTPDIHGCVRLDLVTGPPEKADDDEIQCLGKMLLDSLESSLGTILTMLLEMRLERSQILAVLPVGPHPCCPSEVIRRAEVVQVLENLKDWSWLSVAVAMVPREVVSSDRPRGGSPPQRIDSLSSAMTFHGTRV